MLSDVKFRRTAGCRMFENSVYKMKLNKFPIQEVNCENMDIDELMIKSEFNMPFVIKGISNKLGIKVLRKDQTLSDVADIIGRTFPIKMIEVAEQSEIEGKLGEYADYLKGYTPLHKVINMISLEFSDTTMKNTIQSPSFVREIDWIDTVWPMERKMMNDYPKVQKYCLSGMGTSFTDFHIDFGGTSVWYHVVNGRKRFYLIAPTLRNLQLFKSWSVSSTQADTFFGDVVGRAECFEYDLMPGDTFMIPSGWIHAVYTPEDSLVFGGNFLHKNAILRQMQVYQIEGSTRVGKKYRFPLFRQINWYVLCMCLPKALAKFCSAEDTSGGESDDEDDLDAEVKKMCDNLNTSNLFNQFLILVRICDEWAASISDQYEIEKFLSIAKEYANIDVMYEVIQKWWQVLEQVASLLDITNGNNNQQSHVEYLNYVKDVEGHINLLDDAVVGRALSTFNNQIQGIYDAMNYTPGGNVPKPVEEKLTLTLKLRPKPQPKETTSSDDTSDCHRLPKENPNADSESNTSSYEETLPSTVVDSECSPEEMAQPVPEPEPVDLKSLKFKVPRSSRPTTKVLSDFEDVVPSIKVEEKVAKVVMSSSASSSTDVPKSDPVVVAPAPQSVDKEEALKLKRIHDMNKAKQMLTSTETSPAPKTSRLKLTLSATKKPVEKVNVNTIQANTRGDTDGQRKYGTRGLKLSADYLRNAMDVDFTEVDNYNSGETVTLGETSVEKEEQEFHFVDAESKMKGGDEYSEESGRENDDEDFVEYDSEADAEDHREYRATYNNEEGDDEYRDKDSEGEVIKRKTNKRTHQEEPVAGNNVRPVATGGVATAKKRRVVAESIEPVVKKPFVVDRVSYNSYMGIPQNKPVMTTSSATTTASSSIGMSQAKPVVKPKGGRSAIMKKLGMLR